MGLQDRAEHLKNKPEGDKNEFSDLPPLRFFNMKAGDRNADYLFGMYVVPFISEGATETETFVEQYKHYQLPVGFDDGRPVLANRVCVEKTAPASGIACPFCTVLKQQLETTSQDEKRKEISRMKAKLNAYANVIPVMYHGNKIVHGDGDGQTPFLPHILQVNQTVYDSIARWMIVNEVFDNPTLWPFDVWNSLMLQITIKRQGSRKMDIRYAANFGAGRKPIVDTSHGDEYANAQMEFLAENVYDLSKIFKAPNEEKLQEFDGEAAQLEKILSSKATSTAAANPFGTQKRPATTLATPPASAPKAPVVAPPVVTEAVSPEAPKKKFSFGAPPASIAASADKKNFQQG